MTAHKSFRFKTMFAPTYNGFKPQLLLLTFVAVLFGTVNCQVPFTGCCDAKMMDAGQQVAIDVGRPLTAGIYRGLSVRFCTTDRINIQIWNLVNSGTVQLKWQTTFTPTVPQNQQLYSTINLAVNPITIGDNDRLGLYSYSTGSNWTKIAVPYRVDALIGNMLLTQPRFTDASAFTTGLLATLGSTAYKRTFDQFVRFCSNADCSDLPTITQPQAPTNPSLPSCGCPATCSPDSSITQTLNQQAVLAQYLSSQISKMASQLDSLLSSTANTGICPNGTIAGTYGLGSCYVVVPKLMGANQAAMHCAGTWPNAKVVDIYSNLEQMFIYNMLSNYTAGSPGEYSYWTSGIYSYELKNYVWGQTAIGAENSILLESGYVAFDQNDGGMPIDQQHSCLVTTINTITQRIVWRKEDCFVPRLPICKMPKVCE